MFLGIIKIQAQQPPLIDRELFFGDPLYSGAQISPNGKYISFRKQFNGIMNIWVKDINQKFDEAHPVTADSIRPVRGYFWSRDSKYILYVQDKGGDENFRVYAVDPNAAGDPVPSSRDLTPLDKVRAEIIDVPKNTPDEILIGLNDRNPQLHDVYRLNLITGERTLVRENTDNIAGWQTDLKGNLKLGVRIASDGGTEILKLLKDTVETIYKVNSQEAANPIRFTEEGNSFYMSTNKGTDLDKTELVLYDLKTGKTKLIDKDPLNEVDFAGALFSDVSNKLLATYYFGDKLRIYPKDEDFKEVYKKLRKSFPEGNLGVSSRTADEKIWVITISSDVDPGSVYLFNTETGDAELLYHSRPDLNSDYLSEMKPVTYQARDGLKIHGYLTMPKGLEPKNLPVVMFVHGGPWARDTWGYDAVAQFLANRGYAVFQPNFRGSTGYGKKYLNAGNKQWGRGAMQSDLTDGVKWLEREGIANPKKVVIAGGSYGGYATLAGLTFTPDLYTAGFDIVGPSNIITLLNSIPPYWTPIKKIFDIRVGDMNNPEDLEMMKEASPLNYAKDINAPLYVVQGANDPRVKKVESDQIVVALRDLHRPVEYMLAPDEGHGYAGLENRMAMFTAMEQFIGKYLGGRVQKEVKPATEERLEKITVDIDTLKLPAAGSNSESLLKFDKFDGSKIETGKNKYVIKIETGGRTINLNLNRSVERTNINGKGVIQVIDESSGTMSGSDTLELDAKTLLPVNRSIKQGQAIINLAFTADSVEGIIDMGTRKVPVNIKTQKPVITDGAGVELALRSLPLTAGYKGEFSELDLMKGSAKKVSFAVTGSEKINTTAGEFDTYKVQFKPEDESGVTSTLWIDKNSPKMVKLEQKLNAQMGGGTLTLELTN
jgi:dipeptidyl aminopeptidase/acylaminoacyl peptidase